MSPTRRQIASNLVESWTRIPQCVDFREVDAGKLIETRTSIAAATQGEPVPTFVAFMVKFAAVALLSHPLFNAKLDEDRQEIVVDQDVNIGIATATADGILVPVLRNADQKSLTEITAEVHSIADRARNRRLTPADMRGGTFTVNNIGALNPRGRGVPDPIDQLARGSDPRVRPNHRSRGRGRRLTGRTSGHDAHSHGRPPADRRRRRRGIHQHHHRVRPRPGSVAHQASMMVVGDIPDPADLLVIGGGPGGYASAIAGCPVRSQRDSCRPRRVERPRWLMPSRWVHPEQGADRAGSKRDGRASDSWPARWRPVGRPRGVPAQPRRDGRQASRRASPG